MTPTWQSPCGRVVLYHADNLTVLPTLTAGSIDAVICDPPYGFHGPDDEGRRRNMGVYSWEGRRSGPQWKEAFKPRRSVGVFSGNGPNPNWKELHCDDWNDSIPLDWICLLERFTKPGAAIIAWTDALRPHILQEALEGHRLSFLRTLYWMKNDPPSNPSKNFMSGVEVAVFARMPGKVNSWNGGGCRKNFIQTPKCPGIHKIHPTEKPVRVMEWCIKPVTDTGMTVLDPFMGSGTTGIAALRMGRRFVGIERDDKYFAGALKRIQAECAQGRLFESMEGT